MIWIQGAVLFVLWIAYGVFQSRRSQAIRKRIGSIPPRRRGLVGASLFVVGGMVLIGGLGIVLQQGGFTANGMTPLAWVVVGLLGLGFVHAQTLATAALVSLAQENVTNGRSTSSMNRDPQL